MKKYFLATTAIEKFWNKDETIIFAGEWCKLFSRRKIWTSLNYIDAPFVWENTDIIKDEIQYCGNVYEEAIKELTKILNGYHCLNKDICYYRIILGNWLFHFIDQLYDKFITLKTIFEKYSNLETWILNEKQHYIPFHYGDYSLSQTEDDRYNLQLYSQILSCRVFNTCKLKTKFLSEPIVQPIDYLYVKDIISKKAKLIFFIKKKLRALNSLLANNTITLTSPYITFKNRLEQIRFFSPTKKYCYLLDDFKYPVHIMFDIDHKFRKQKLLFSNCDEFKRVLSSVLLQNIPILFVEGFKEFRKQVLDSTKNKSKIFFTSNAFHNNYIYKFFIGENYKNFKIFNMQHGGGYGTDLINRVEEYEKFITDIFFTSGWSKDKKTKPLSIPKFRPTKYKKSSGNTILFGINVMPRYVYRLQFSAMSSAYLSGYLEPALSFIKHFDKKNILHIRCHPKDDPYRWNTCERIKEQFPACVFDDFSKNFKDKLLESKCYVTSCAHTTYLESLAANKPTIIFLNKNIIRFYPDAQPYFDMLENVKILHYCPISAAAHLNNVYDNIEDWWQNIRVQQARKNFIKKYAWCSENWISDWKKEFNNIFNGSDNLIH